MDHTIKTFEDACQLLGIDPDDVLHAAHSEYLKNDIVSINAYSKLIIIARALNDGWKPDWQDNDQYKHYPWFDMEKDKNNPSGFRFYSVDCLCTTSCVGSRLCFKNEELAEYAGKQFIDLYKDFMVI